MGNSHGHGPKDADAALEHDEDYDRLVELEDLESLLEEMEEQGVVSLDPPASVSSEIRDRMQTYGVRDVQQVRDRIMHLHARIDEDEDDVTISDS